MTREEARTWFVAMTTAHPRNLGRTYDPKVMVENLVQTVAASDPGPLSFEAIYDALKEHSNWPPEILIPLANLVGVEDIMRLLKSLFDLYTPGIGPRYIYSSLTGFNPSASLMLFNTFAEGILRYLEPYLDDERDTVRDAIRPLVSPNRWPNNYTDTQVYFHIAAKIGMPVEMQAVVESWPDGHFTVTPHNQSYFTPQRVVFGLPHAAQIEAHFRRLKMGVYSPEYIRALLACTEYACLDVIRDSILAVTGKGEAEQLVRAFAAAVVAPEVAPHMLALKQGSKAPAIARQWLDDHPAEAIAGLVPVAADGDKLADAALDYLHILTRKGYGAAIAAEADALGDPEGAARVRAVLTDAEETRPVLTDATTPTPLRDALATVKPGKLPGWVVPNMLPPITVGGARLNEAQTAAVVRVLQKVTLQIAPHPLITALKTHAAPASLDAFAWALFQEWLGNGAPSKEGWAMTALGLLGGDATVLKLMPLIRAWPGEGQHQRAVGGLAVLQSIGSDTALMQINGIAQKTAFAKLKSRAQEAMTRIAADRHMSRAALEDRIVPDCGLDARGSRLFDFGPRQFTFAFAPDLTPKVRDAAGVVRPDLPKPNNSDDAEKAASAVADWKLLKKQVREVAKIQALRLEQAMVTGRRWTPDEFAALLVRHPLMGLLVRLLVWGGYNSDGQLAATFRVTEDGTYADASDDEMQLGGGAAIGIVHPLQLDDAAKAAWGQIFGDYAIIPPFPQLGRAVYRLTAAEGEMPEITRFAGLKIPSVSLVGTLERLGWERGAAQDAGIFFDHDKSFDDAGITAVVEYPGVPMGDIVNWEDQQIERCYFVPTPRRLSHRYDNDNHKLPLKDIDPVAVSEVLSDLTIITAKARNT